MAQQYKPGDWYSAASGMIMQYNGSSWKAVGQQGTPSAIEAIKGRAVNAPGAASNPYVSEAVEEATAQAAGEVNDDPKNTGRINLLKRRTGISAASPAGEKVLKYPKEVATSFNSDYVVFEFFEYNPPFGRGKGGDGAIPTDAFIDNPTAGYKRYNESDVAKKSADLPSILMYMPEDIQSVYSQRWGGAEFGSFAAGLLQTAGTQVNLTTAIETGIGQIKTTTFNAIQALTNKLSGSNISLNQTLGGISGTILNPNTEMMYEGPNTRTFDLTFKLVAYSEEESLEIRRICNVFKKAMLPTFGGQAIFGFQEKAPNLLTIPKICQVSFMKGPNLHPFLSQYKTCAIADVSVNYTADGSYATYIDGGPISTQLKISFKEMKNIFAEEIQEEGPSY